MTKGVHALVFKFSVVLAVFSTAILFLNAGATYYNQTRIYKSQCENQIWSVAEYLEELMMAQGDDFLRYQDCFLRYYKDARIPYTFTEFNSAKKHFERLAAQEFPGQTFGIDYEFSELSEEAPYFRAGALRLFASVHVLPSYE